MSFEITALYDAAHAALSTVVSEQGTPKSLNEAETRTHVIDPVIKALGYESLDEVRREYRLPDSGQFVDYLLQAGEQRIVVEAKPLGVELTGKEASQLVGYCAQEGVRWALLTNGLTWTAFDIEASGNWEAKRVVDLDLLGAFRDGHLAHALAPLANFARETLERDDQSLTAWAHEERARTHLDRLLTEADSLLITSAVSELARLGIDLEADDVVSLLKRGTATPTPEPAPSRPVPPVDKPPLASETQQYFIFPAAPAGGFSAEDHLRRWLESGAWGLRGTTAHRKKIQQGDRACFYAKGLGVVAQASITGPADREVTPRDWPGPDEHSDNVFRVPLSAVHWLETPRKIDVSVREKLEAFAGRDLSRPWSWFIQSTNRVSPHDFDVLTE